MVDIISSSFSGAASISSAGVYGRVDTAGDVDMYKVTLSGGNYHINLGGDRTFGSALSDTVLRIYNSSGQLVAVDDDNGAGSSSYLDFVAASSGTHYIAVSGYSTYTGDYGLLLHRDDTPDHSYFGGLRAGGSCLRR